MSNPDSVVGIFESHALAEASVRELQEGGLDIKKLSIVGRDYHTEKNVVGYYSTGDGMKCWGKYGAFWGGLWGLLMGAGFFSVPALGPLLVAGPLVTKIIGVIEGATVVGGLSVVGAGLSSMGIAKVSTLRYETAIRGGKLLLIFQGTLEEVEKARQAFDRTQAVETALHPGKLVPALSAAGQPVLST